MKFLTICLFIFSRLSVSLTYNSSCGMDRSPATMVYEGIADIEMYPWLGVLIYPMQDHLKTSTVILITQNLVLAAAIDVDQYPKADFRARAKVILGQNCSGRSIGVRDYTYHPDYSKHSYSSLAIVQLKTVLKLRELHPICPPPPADYKVGNIYALTVTPDCGNLKMMIYKMEYVSQDNCKQFYRRSDLDMESMWPRHFACARGVHGGDCIWHNGAALVTKHQKKWRLLGFGIYGPGCEAPARFLDYGIYHQWVRNSVAKIGEPAISRMGADYIILRRTVSNVQRFGTCDREEVKEEIYIDETQLNPEERYIHNTVRYNLTLLANVDYSCIVIRVTDELGTTNITNKPRIFLRRFCTSRIPLCYDFNILQIDFYVEIRFSEPATYKISAYGKEFKIIDVKAVMAYTNSKKPWPPLMKRMSEGDWGTKFKNGPIVTGTYNDHIFE